MSLLLIIFACCTGSLVAALVGLIGARRKIGFGWTFFLSLVFTPFIGLLFALLSDRLPDGERKWGCLGVILGILTLIAIIGMTCILLGAVTV